MQLTEDEIVEAFIEWASESLSGDMAEYLDGADEATASFVSPDKGHVCIDGSPFAKWCASTNGIDFKL